MARVQPEDVRRVFDRMVEDAAEAKVPVSREVSTGQLKARGVSNEVQMEFARCVRGMLELSTMDVGELRDALREGAPLPDRLGDLHFGFIVGLQAAQLASGRD